MKTLTILLLFCIMVGCDKDSQETVIQQVTPSVVLPSIDGNAIAVVVDCSGSMADRISGGIKIDIARNVVHKVFKQVESFSKNKDVPVKIALYRFSDDVKCVWPANTGFAIANETNASPSIDALTADGGTAMGRAVIVATRDLNESRYNNVNIIVITDGESNVLESPSDVSAAFSHLPAQYRPKVFVVAFDTNASIFDNVKKNGWKVLSASNGDELDSTLNTLVGGEILLEK